MARGGTVLSQYGIAMEDAVGLITAANESIQDPAKVGNALKSLAINMSGLKANASKGTMELNKTAKALKEIAGIDVYSDKSKGQVKDMVTILDELNVKLKEGKLNQDEFLALSEALAGKEQAAVFQALMGNYETFKQIQGEFAEGLHFGSAEKENAAYVDSLNGKLNKLKEVWIDTLMVLADSDALKGLLDNIISISEGINKFIKGIDSIGLTFPVLLGLISGTSSGFKVFNSSIEAASSEGAKFGLSLDGIKNTISSGVVPAIKGFVKQGLLIGGITLAVQGVALAWDKLNNSVKDAGKELQSVEDEHLSNISSQNQKIKTLETVGVQYEQLANKAKRTAEEEQEMIRLGNELAQILPEMVIGYDEENNAILHMTDDMDGLIEKTKEAKEQYEGLLLGTRMEQSSNALKMLTDGELFGKDALGLYDQKVNVQEKYYERMAQLQQAYNTQLENATNFEGKTRENALKRMRELKNQMITEESKYQTQYSEIQSRILEQSNIFRDEMDSTWRNSANLLTTELTPALEKSIQAFVNTMDFSEISDENELEAVRRIFREIPELAQSGAVDIDKLSSQIADINKEFSNTGNLEDYHTNMKELAKSVSSETGWDASVLEEMFTKITDGTLKSSMGLENFLETFGKTKKDIQNGDSIAKALHQQFNEIESVLNAITMHDFDNAVANLQLRINLQENTNLPKQVRDMVDKLVKEGVDDKHIISVTGELMMYLKDGKLDEGEVEALKEELRSKLEGKMSKQEVELAIEGIIKSFNSDEILKSIEGELGDKKVTKEVTIEADDPDKINAINEAMEKVAKREKVYAAIEAVVGGDNEKFLLFSEIIEKLPVNKEFTNKFIIENADALSKLTSYQEVVDYINSLPDEVKKTYGITTEGLEETLKDTKELDKTITGVNSNELKVTASNDDVLQTIEDVEALIEISAKVEDGKYKIDIDANTQTAIDNINKFKDAINELNSNLSKSKTVSYKAETAQAAKNISGLIDRVNQIKKLTGKTFKYYSDTAQAAKNITGLINKVNEINKKNGKTFTWYANTAQAAKNISGLIDRINQINGKSSKTFNYTVNTSYKKQSLEDDEGVATPQVASDVVSEVAPVSAVADEIAAQTSNIQASLRTGIGEINSFSSNMARATSKTPININYGNSINAIKYNVELLQELQNRIDKVNNSISLLDKKMENAMGSKKITYLQQQNKLYQEQANIQKELESSLKKQQSYYKSYLQGKGFSFNSDGNLTNYEEKLIAMQKEAERLNNLADAANDRYNNYSGDNENYKNQLKSTYEAAKKKADDYSESLSEIQQFLNAYIDVTFTELPKVQEEWQDLQNAITENKIAILEAKDELSDINLDIRTNNIENALAKIKKELNSLEREIDKSFGSKRESLLTDKINKLKEEQNKLHQLANAYRVQRNEISSFLNTQGFKFDKDGNITNLDNILKYQNDPAMLQYLQNLIDKYEDLGSTIDGFSEEWWDLQDSIEDTRDEIEEARKELAKFLEEAKVEALTDKFNDLANTLDLIDKKLEHSTGKDKLDLISQKLNIIKQQQIEVEKQWEFFNTKKNTLKSELSGLGFKFDKDGNITNYVAQLEKLANSSSDFEEVTEKLEEYFSIQDEELPNLQNSWQDLENTYKDTLKEQLNTTKEIEDKITDIYKKQVEDRIDAMNKETDAKIKALKKQQDAYNAYRDEVDYQEEYDEKLQEITDLQKQLDIAMRDTSLNGQKKVQELQLQIAQAQKELQKLTQDKIDQNINDMFDKEAERIEEENEKNIEELENQWSDTKIAEMVAQALGSGIFTDIEGNVSSLEDALVNFADETGELFGILGATIKSELITNLEIAKDTVNSLATIMKELDLSAYVSAQNTRSISSATSRMATSGSYSDINNQVTITAPIINIEGNVDNNVVDELKNISNRIKEQVINAIAGSIR